MLSYLVFNSQLQDLFECVYRVLTTDGITLKIPNVVVCGEEHPDNILLHYMLSSDLENIDRGKQENTNGRRDLSSGGNQCRQRRPLV